MLVFFFFKVEAGNAIRNDTCYLHSKIKFESISNRDKPLSRKKI